MRNILLRRDAMADHCPTAMCVRAQTSALGIAIRFDYLKRTGSRRESQKWKLLIHHMLKRTSSRSRVSGSSSQPRGASGNLLQQKSLPFGSCATLAVVHRS